MTRFDHSTDLVLVMRAADFAASRHSDQRRKGPDQEPYINHLIEVAHLLARSAHGNDGILLAAGFLHDVIEDTDTQAEELVDQFGAEVAAVVAEVTDDKRLRKDERKRLQVETVTRKSRRAQLLTMADKTANIGSLVRGAPTDWPRGRIVEYGHWAESVVQQIRGTDAFLDGAFADAMRRFDARFRPDV